MADLVNIKTFFQRHEAELAKGLLAEKGIEAIVSADDCGGMRRHLSLGMGQVKLLVNKEDAERAKEVLKVLEDQG
jgi:hypothetical protein